MLSGKQRSRERGGAPSGGPVPYIAQWSSERTPPHEVVMRRGQIAYADERPYDRDSDGVLWNRTPSTPGRGRPERSTRSGSGRP
jgi:hypothetical protein